MTDLATAGRATPWHFWLVAVIAVLWNGFGGYDYVMSHVQGDAYLRSAGMTEAQVAYFNDLPAWMTACWAIGVWSSVAGTLLLILRSRWAFHAFVLSLLGFLASLSYTHLMSNGGEVMGQFGMIMNGVVAAAIVFFIWYAQVMTRRGVLR
ncbi:MAG: hypothetical protein U1C74_22810 [Phenylobacterium sp.]|nr:hypothetical protein [Phenylobacterium sp.]